ncbi:MAG: hypothetical protein HY823_06055 [Acidobacteria bacterium]|nr:hypothetical protein [Acidobacteriota bacterium]
MRATLPSALMLACLACAPVSTVVLSAERIPPGSGITLMVGGPDGPGVEHQVTKALQDAGFKVFSGSLVSLAYATPVETGKGARDIESELIRKFPSPYLCRIKGSGFVGATALSNFTLQLVNAENGRVILSLNGQNGTYSGEDIARALLTAISTLK